MRRTKPLYVGRVADQVYFIYRLSNYARKKIKLIRAGLAYDDRGNRTKRCEKDLKKYNIDSRTLDTSSTYNKFLEYLFLNAKQTKITRSDLALPIPSTCYEILKDFYEDSERKKERKRERKLRRMEVEKNRVLDEESERLFNEIDNVLKS
jgi:hypothetical protein